MRTKFDVRKLRPAYLLGVLTFAIPGSAVSLAAGPSPIRSAPQFKLAASHLAYGENVGISGTTAGSQSGQRLELEYKQSNEAWRPVAYTTVTAGGRFRFSVRLWRSGLVRVQGAGGTPTEATNQAASTTATGGSSLAASPPREVVVTAGLSVPHRAINVLSGQTANVRGHLLVGVPGRRVQLQRRVGNHWQTLATTSTDRGGRFDLRYVTGNLGAERLRVRFPGDRANASTSAHAGVLTVYQETVASWYEDGGDTACGFHATDGVANKSLPCGTKVRFMLGGRTVVATVDDRGPFVAGRTWDLNQNTAAALGVSGVATLWSSQ
jgi:hypothetical protein